MPEFILEGRDTAKRTESAFVLGFIEAMFFTESSPAYMSDEWFTAECKHAQEEGQSDGTLPGDVGYEDLHPDALKSIREFCERKQAKMADLLALAYERDYDEEQAGRDLWFTYNGHGVGYWDRKPLDADGLGDRLSKACGRGELSPWFGDHVTYGDAPFVHLD
jgi:hypothetical protein